MGIFTVYCVLSGTPGYISQHKNYNKKIYGWHQNVRAVLKDGSISNIGSFDMDGYVRIQHTKKSLLDLFPKKEEISVMDYFMHELQIDADAFLINNKVYNLIKKHKDYTKCIKNKNLFNLLLEFYYKTNKNMVPSFVGMQQFYIPDKNNNSDDSKFIKKDLWKLTDPDLKTKDGLKNKKRIDSIINKFVKFACDWNNKNIGIIQVNLEYKDSKSNKFWNIQYDKNSYIVNYGKIGKKGITMSKKATLSTIEGLIQSKLNKGYVKKSQKKINKFTLLNKNLHHTNNIKNIELKYDFKPNTNDKNIIYNMYSENLDFISAITGTKYNNKITKKEMKNVIEKLKKKDYQNKIIKVITKKIPKSLIDDYKVRVGNIDNKVIEEAIKKFINEKYNSRSIFDFDINYIYDSKGKDWSALTDTSPREIIKENIYLILTGKKKVEKDFFDFFPVK